MEYSQAAFEQAVLRQYQLQLDKDERLRAQQYISSFTEHKEVRRPRSPPRLRQSFSHLCFFFSAPLASDGMALHCDAAAGLSRWPRAVRASQLAEPLLAEPAAVGTRARRREEAGGAGAHGMGRAALASRQ